MGSQISRHHSGNITPPTASPSQTTANHHQTEQTYTQQATSPSTAVTAETAANKPFHTTTIKNISYRGTISPVSGSGISSHSSKMPHEGSSQMYEDRLRVISRPSGDYLGPGQFQHPPHHYHHRHPHHSRHHSNHHHHHHYIHNHSHLPNHSHHYANDKHSDFSVTYSHDSRGVSVRPTVVAELPPNISVASPTKSLSLEAPLLIPKSLPSSEPSPELNQLRSDSHVYPSVEQLDITAPYQWYSWPIDILPSNLAKSESVRDLLRLHYDSNIEINNEQQLMAEEQKLSNRCVAAKQQPIATDTQSSESDHENTDTELWDLATEVIRKEKRERKSGAILSTITETYALGSQESFLREHSIESFKLDDENDLVACVFSWSHGGHSVYLTGSFDDWSIDEKIKLVRSGHEFTTIKELPRGVHYYKFIVDDQWRFSPNQPTHTDEHGNVNNILDLSDYRYYNFAIPKEHEQAREETYHQFVPGSNDYTTDAPVIPILLSKSNCVAAEPPSRISAPLHALSNHLYHDSHAAHLFGPHITCVTSTQRWRYAHKSPLSTAGLRFSTLTYVTFNPLFPCHGDPAFELHAASRLRSLLASRRLMSADGTLTNNTTASSVAVPSSTRESTDLHSIGPTSTEITSDVQIEIFEASPI